MPDNIFIYFLTGIILFSAGKIIYYYIEKKKILKTCKQINSIELKNISGTVFTDAGRNKRFEWCSFNLLFSNHAEKHKKTDTSQRI